MTLRGRAALFLMAAALIGLSGPLGARELDTAEAARELVRHVNAARVRAGLTPLHVDDRLAVAAEAHAQDLASGLRTRSPDDFGDRLGRVGYVYLSVSEIIASGTATASQTADLILADRDKRARLLDRSHVDIGVGFASRPDSLQPALRHDRYWSIMLARQAEALPPLAEIRAAMLRAVNRHRSSHRLSVLQLDERLNEAAQAHSMDMASFRTMAHQGSDGRYVDDRLQRAGYAFALAAENIARNSFTAEQTVSDWVSSAAHNANMLRDDVEEVGVGVVERFDTAATVQRFWTLVLARPSRQQGSAATIRRR